MGLVLLSCLVAAAGATGCGSDDAGNPDSELSLAEATMSLPSQAPPELAAIREQANELLGGGSEAFDRRLAELKGTPVVVNKWASWCGPCRAEFPFFQSQAVEHGDEIAFLGVDSDDSDEAARTFLGELPLPYPSFADPELEIARSLEVEREFPATVFIDSSGEAAYEHLGGYASEDDLAADIDRYAR